MTAFIQAKICPATISTFDRISSENGHKLRSWSQVVLPSQELCRRSLLCNGMSLVAFLTFNNALTPWLARAEETPNHKEEEENGVIGTIKSIFDPNERTKSGKVLPKAYLKSAREVVKTLRESLQEDSKDGAKFRRTADAAKESIRDYLGNWLGQQAVIQEESYAVLEKAIRSLAGFYAKAGPSAPLPEDVKSDILNDLDKAEEFL
ncbi:photosystem II D1 precursor processing protein PSB27-H2, chloroplastic [Cucurbita maxima]|uniref:Photosystem II D1 precursor processing protein PSB27-H2, chloroplastic n=1 Tax=Cucurbita maxima TaxID=3661 RepID=A0A6J1KWY8_CUCMA|nr:photosystem II D1 precursor processing protein PSB27-H2, chloroplastic [Cucurbita maxima]XP_023006141.1 photosystem II D1 precursor processing protein PSB27-H2, chloroplastic [Cucurbita maxima]XP_023006142.1 photosystem II D1 precursor processing protein PSB27-H2, chloroplastic [Cucurbita maxima]